jgi:hypothetical protein
MSAVVMRWFLRLEDKPEDDKLWKVLAVMAHSADLAGGNIRLATETIALRAGPNVSRATVRRRIEDALAEAAQPWALEVAAAGDRRRATVYRFLHYSPELSATSATGMANTGEEGSELLATNGQYVGQSPTHPGQQMATTSTTLATKVFKVSRGLATGPDPEPLGRPGSVAETAPAVAAPSDPVGKAEALRAARLALAAGCARCDGAGWLDYGDGTGKWCDHTPAPAGERHRVAVDETAMPLPDTDPPATTPEPEPEPQPEPDTPATTARPAKKPRRGKRPAQPEAT